MGKEEVKPKPKIKSALRLEQERFIQIIKPFQINKSEYLNEIANSGKCKAFDKYLKFTSKGINDCCGFFSDATNNEVEFFSRKFIDHVIENPKEIKILGLIASNWKKITKIIKKFIQDLVKRIETEFKDVKQGTEDDLIEIKVLGSFLGELYVSEKKIINPEFMTRFLNYLNCNKDKDTIASTLKLCGYFYKITNKYNFNNFMKSIKVNRPIIEDEIFKMYENYENDNQIYRSRLFKPTESAINSNNLEETVAEITKNENVRFSFNISAILNINNKELINLIVKTLQKQDTNVIELAKFIKSIHNFALNIENFLTRLQINLKKKIFKMSKNNLQKIRSIGMITAELTSLKVFDKANLKIWLEKVETLHPRMSFEVMEVYVDVLKVISTNIKIIKSKETHYIRQRIHNTIRFSKIEAATRIEAKIAQIIHNVVLKKVNFATQSLLYIIRNGYSVESLPVSIPVNDPKNLDIKDVAQNFYNNVISNQHLVADFTDAIKVLKTGPRGAEFIQSLSYIMFLKLFLNTISPDFCESNKVTATVELLFHIINENVLTDSEMISFLQAIQKMNNLGNYKEMLDRLFADIQLIADNKLEKDNKMQKYIKKIQNMLENKDVKSEEVTQTISKQKRGKNRVKSTNKTQIPIILGNSKQISSKIHQTLTKENTKSSTISILDDQITSKLYAIVKSTQKRTKNLLIYLKNLLLKSKTTSNAKKLKQKILKMKRKLLRNSVTSRKFNHKRLESKTYALTLNDQQTQSTSLEISHLLKKVHLEYSWKNLLLYEQLFSRKPFKIITEPIPKIQSSIAIRINLNELIKKPFSVIKNKCPLKSAKKYEYLPILPQMQSIKQINPELLKLYNTILPMISKNKSQFMKYAIMMHNWKIYGSEPKSQRKELIGLLSKELKSHHKQLLQDICKHLTDECDILHRGQIKGQQRSFFILSFRAVIPFLEMSQFYDILHCLLKYIGHRNRDALVLFLDIIDEIDNVLSVDCKERYIFAVVCVKVLEISLKPKRQDKKIKQRTTKILEYFKSVKILQRKLKSINKSYKRLARQFFQNQQIASKDVKTTRTISESSQKSVMSSVSKSSQSVNSEALYNQIARTSNLNVLTYSPVNFKIDSKVIINIEKSKELSQTSKRYGQLAVNSSQSGQSSGPSSQVARTNSIIVADPQVNSSADAKVMFYISQLQSSNVELIASKVSPILAKNFSKQRFLEVLLQQGISDQKHINPVIDLFNLLSKKTSFKKSLVQITAEITSKFLNLCVDCENQEQKMMNLTKFTVAFEPNIQNPFWYQLWQQLAEFIKQNYPNALKLLVLLMTEKIDMLCNIKDHKKLIRQIMVLFKNKLAVEQDEKLIEKIKILIKTIENGMEAAENPKGNSQKVKNVQVNLPNNVSMQVGTSKENAGKLPTTITKVMDITGSRHANAASLNKNVESNQEILMRALTKDAEIKKQTSEILDKEEQSSWFEISFLLKPGGSYDGQSKPIEQASNDSSNAAKTNSDLRELIQQTILTTENKKLALKSERQHKLQPIQSTDSDVHKLYEEILPIITTNASQLRKCAIAFYSWKLENPDLKPQINELAELLSKELQNHHEKLLTDVCKDLKDEFTSFCIRQEVKRKKRKCQLSQQVLTSRAVISFVKKYLVYDILFCMLINIKDSKKIGLELFLGVVEGLEDILSIDCKERIAFADFCVKNLDEALSIKNEDLEITKRTTKMLEFFKSININPEIPSPLPESKKIISKRCEVPKDSSSTNASILQVQAKFSKIQPGSNESFIQTHQDDVVRPLNFTSDYFLFDDSITNPQKFEKILKDLCEDCKSLEINKDNSIKIKEFIAVAIIKINLLKTHPNFDEINKYAEIFFELYTRLDQTKCMQWVLIKLVKAWKLFDQTYGADSLIPDEKMAKIYDRYSKSIVRITKYFTISNTNAIQNDKSDGKSSSLDNITSKTKNLQTVPDIPRNNDNITSNTDDQKTKSKTVNSRTITFKFDDMVAKSDKSSSPALNLKNDEVKLKVNDRSFKSNDITSKYGDITSKYGDITSKSVDITSKSGDLTLKSGDITSKFGDITSKSGDITSKSDDFTSKSDDLTSKSGDITSKSVVIISKSGDLTSKSGDLTLKSGFLTSKSDDITLKSDDLTSKSDDLTSKSGDLTSKSDNITSKSISSKLINFFMTCLQNLLLKNLIDTTVDVDRDPYFDYFLYKKRRTYEIVCDLHFHDLISSNFIFHCVTKMFQNPLIIDKSLDVVVRLMILVESFIIIRHKSNDFNYILQDVKTFWSRLPFGVEMLYPISVDKWTFLKNFTQKSLFFRCNQVEFSGVVEKMWTELMENPGKFNEIVQIFEDFLEVLGDSFAVLIVDFMENRRNSLEKFPIENILKPISLKYKTSILFAFELFEMGILNCELFSKWLNDKIYGKLVQEHNSEILLKFGQKGLKIDGNLDENLMNYYKKLNNFG